MEYTDLQTVHSTCRTRKLSETCTDMAKLFRNPAPHSVTVVCLWLTDICRSMLSIDLIFHPSSLTAAAPALSSAGLVNVIGDKAALIVHTRHILIIVAQGVMGRRTGVLCHDFCCYPAVQSSVRQFGNVTVGIRSLHRAR